MRFLRTHAALSSMTAPASRPRTPMKVAVVGGGRCDETTGRMAEDVGRRLAANGAVLLCGGGGGVMEAAARGASSEAGLTVGILPGSDMKASPPNPHIAVPLFTGMGQARNVVLVLSADAVIAIGGEWGTLSEIAIAMKHGKPLVLLGSWRVEPPGGEIALPMIADSAAEAVSMALQPNRSTGVDSA